MINFLLKHRVGVILGVIVLLAFLIRIYDIQNLFVFKMDQARDISLVQEAYTDGVGELPLLGPRAAKTYLRLGPIFYYFEYLSMWLTGNKSPLSVVWPDLIFSLLTIPLFYYFLRQAFNKQVSLMTTVIFASSFFLTQYSRFAWNPNSIPFWSLLYFLGLYKVVESRKSKVESQRKGRWLLVAMIGYGIASQLHFTAMLAYPLTGVLFVFISLFIKGDLLAGVMSNVKSQKSKVKSQKSIVGQLTDYFTRMIRQTAKEGVLFVKSVNWKYWLGALAILGIFYLPVILSEVYTHGDNWIQFKYALSGRGKEEFSLWAKLVQSVKLHSEYFWFSLTSVEKGGSNFGVLGFFLAGLLAVFSWGKKLSALGWSAWGGKVNNNQKNHNIFFLLIFIWGVVMFGLYTKLAFNVLKPRYWLLELPIFFVILATLIEQSINWFKHQGKTLVLVIILVGGIVGMNLWATMYWYGSVQNQQEGQVFYWELKLKDENKIPWGQLNKVANYLTELSERTDKDVCFYTTGEYRPVYDYIFKQRGLSNKIRRISFGSDSNEKCLFVGIDHNQKREIPRIPKRHRDEFEKVVDGKKEIGFVTVWEVRKKSPAPGWSASGGKVIPFSNGYAGQKSQKSVKLEGGENKDNFGNKGNKINNENLMGENGEEVGNDEPKEKVKKPRRVERVRWKDVFKNLGS